MRKLLLLCSAALLLVSGCSSDEKDVQQVDNENAPKSQIETRKVRNGKITGEDGITIVGHGKKDEGGGALGVNSYLWRATLDTLSFMPLVSADPFGGVIITDWYEDPKTPGERFKVNALILDKSLRADGVKLTVFKQTMEHGMWRDQKASTRIEQQLEDTILTRARQLRVAQGTK